MTVTKVLHSGSYRARANKSPNDADIWATFRALREARGNFGLRSGHLQTLQAMLSFLKPGHGDTVFASNNSICERAGGIDERTLRRHINRFVELGFVQRQDSTNRKRYRVRASDGRCVSFGISFTPLLARASEFLELAEHTKRDRQDMVFLRKQILEILARLEEQETQLDFVQTTRRLLRRKMCVSRYRQLLQNVEAQSGTAEKETVARNTTVLSVNDGQTVRHQSKSDKEDLDKNPKRTPAQLELRTLLATCREARAFAVKELNDWHDIERHARTLAPMMGIHPQAYEAAKEAIGPKKASSAVFIILQLGSSIRNIPAYFHSITTGTRRERFEPVRILRRLSDNSLQTV